MVLLAAMLCLLGLGGYEYSRSGYKDPEGQWIVFLIGAPLAGCVVVLAGVAGVLLAPRFRRGRDTFGVLLLGSLLGVIALGVGIASWNGQLEGIREGAVDPAQLDAVRQLSDDENQRVLAALDVPRSTDTTGHLELFSRACYAGYRGENVTNPLDGYWGRASDRVEIDTEETFRDVRAALDAFAESERSAGREVSVRVDPSGGSVDMGTREIAASTRPGDEHSTRTIVSLNAWTLADMETYGRLEVVTTHVDGTCTNPDDEEFYDHAFETYGDPGR